jgi:hypothetical protein
VIPRSFPMIAIAAVAVAWVGASSAAEYKPDEFLSMDLSKVILSPQRLGPPTQFAPVAVEARGDTQARVAPDVQPRKVATEHVKAPERRMVHTKPVQARGAARTRLAHRHTNPMDAQAMDTRIQTWPCRSGGICDWKR